MQWIEDHISVILVFFLIIFAVEGAIWCWRMPEDFRSEVIPKIDRMIKSCKEDKLNDQDKLFLYTHTHYYNAGPKR
jgi:hypothetical protein